MRFRITVGDGGSRGAGVLPDRTTIGRATLETDAGATVVEHDGEAAALIGIVTGSITAERRLEPVGDLANRLCGLSADSDLAAWAAGLEGSFVVAHVDRDGGVRIAADRFGTRDTYLQPAGGGAVASSLDLLPTDPASGGLDQSAIAHALLVYGTRAPKRHTNYVGTSRLGVGETASLGTELNVIPHVFEPVASTPWGTAEHEEYAETFLGSLESSGSNDGNVVYLSSGWDSTSILAGLVHVFGRGRVRAVIGRMHYSERSGYCNRFELERAAKVADHFGVPLDIVELDYVHHGPDVVDDVRDLFRNRNIASLTGLNHSLLAAGAAATAIADEVVFAGEISDGAHNLGFSQFVTMFHPVQAFREYADKMNSYLFGPTFLQSLLDGQHEDDFVYQLFRDRSGASFEAPSSTPEGRKAQVLASLFLRPSRVPLSAPVRDRVLTDDGIERYRADIEDAYLGDAARRADPTTLYAWYLHLYNSFHWQGSTVATLALTAEAHGLRSALPFWDSGLQASLSAMPEGCGRGLDLNQTKYPLKWTLRNKIDYPFDLQVGPHSYTYDVDPSFNHSIEVLYHSQLRGVFVDALREKPYSDALDPSVFNLGHINSLVDAYLRGDELRGADLNELVAIGLTAVYRWFG